MADVKKGMADMADMKNGMADVGDMKNGMADMKRENAKRDDGVNTITLVMQKVSVLLAESETQKSIVHLSYDCATIPHIWLQEIRASHLLAACTVMDVSKGAFTAVITQGYKIEYGSFTAAVKQWFEHEENRVCTSKLARTLRKARPVLGLEELRSPEPLTLRNFKDAIKTAMSEVPFASLYQAILVNVDAAVEDAIQRKTRDYEKEQPEVAKALAKLQHVVQFPRLRELPTQITSTNEPAFILAAVAACSAFADACPDDNKLPQGFKNPIWSKSQDAKTRMISEDFHQELLTIFLPIFRNPVAIYQLLFWQTLRDLANAIAHPNLSQPNQFHHFTKKGWLEDSGREVFRQVSDLAVEQPELWATLVEGRGGRGLKGGHSVSVASAYFLCFLPIPVICPDISDAPKGGQLCILDGMLNPVTMT